MRAARGLILVVLTASSFFLWLGIPVLVLWGLSTANGVYLRVTGRLPAEDTDRRRPHMGGPLEFLLISSLLVSIVALLIWFFLFAENPPRQFI